jgi:chromosomal replication initiator protein
MANNGFELIWKEICTGIRKRVSGDTFKRWFSETMLVFADEERLTIRVPNNIYQLWIESNYMVILKHSVMEVLLAPRDIDFEVAGKSESAAAEIFDAESSDVEEGDDTEETELGFGLRPSHAPTPPEKYGEVEEVLETDVRRALKRAGMNSRYSFDTFVVGANSEFARAACISVAERPALTYNPLFIHSSPGLGKTHLLHAIGRQVLMNDPKKRVVLVTSEEFCNDFIDALQHNTLAKFRNRYRKADVLLIDDVHFIAGKERSQEEFFHTFNTLTDGRRQVVLTSDRPPSEIAQLEERIVTRCEWGLTADLQPPDVETRIAILRKKMVEWKVSLPDHVIEFLADRIRKSVRRLEGALMRLASYNSLSGTSLTEERIEGLLKDILREEGRRRVTVSRIQKEVADHFDIRLQDMTSKRRPANIAFPRQIAMYLSRTMTDMSLVEIGQAFGGRDHGTVIHAQKAVEKKMTDSNEIRQAVAVIHNRLSCL